MDGVIYFVLSCRFWLSSDWFPRSATKAEKIKLEGCGVLAHMTTCTYYKKLHFKVSKNCKKTLVYMFAYKFPPTKDIFYGLCKKDKQLWSTVHKKIIFFCETSWMNIKLSRHHGIFLKLFRHFEVWFFDSGCISTTWAKVDFRSWRGCMRRGRLQATLDRRSIDACTYPAGRMVPVGITYSQYMHMDTTMDRTGYGLIGKLSSTRPGRCFRFTQAS
jgi:hypothetical protein